MATFPSVSKRNTRTFSLQGTLISLTVGLLLMLGLLLTVVFYQGNRRVINQMTEFLLSELYFKADTVSEDFVRFNNISMANLEIDTSEFVLGNKRDVEGYLHRLGDALRNNEGIKHIHYTDAETGTHYEAAITDDGDIGYKVYGFTGTQTYLYEYVETIDFHPSTHIHKTGFLGEPFISSNPVTDHRTTSIYQQAEEIPDISWGLLANVSQSVSQAFNLDFFFYTTKALYLNETNTNQISGVFGAIIETGHVFQDIVSEVELSYLMESTTSSVDFDDEAGFYLLLLDEDENIIASSDPETLPVFSEEEGKVFRIQDHPNTLFGDIYERYNALDLDLDTESWSFLDIGALLFPEPEEDGNSWSSTEVLKIAQMSAEDKNYYVFFEEIRPTKTLPLKIGAVINEDIFLSSLTRTINIALFISLFLMTITIMINWRVISYVVGSLKTISKDMQGLGIIKENSNPEKDDQNSRLREIRTLQTSYHKMRSVIDSFNKFIPREVVSELVREGKQANISGEEKEVTILFSDIEQFTLISEITPAEELIAQLRFYFNRLSKEIYLHKGTLDKYMGDSIMAFWGAPQPTENHALSACIAAITCSKLTKEMNAKFERAEMRRLKTRIGIDTGKVIVGNIGSDARLNYTVLGESVNFANRLEGLNKTYQTPILISGETYAAATNKIFARLVDKVTLYTKDKRREIYELIDLRDNLTPKQLKFYDIYAEGVHYYFERQWKDSARAFYACLKVDPSDAPSRRFIKSCVAHDKNPPNKEWDGTSRLQKQDLLFQT